MMDFPRRDTSQFFLESDLIVRAMPFHVFENQFETGGGQTTNGQKMTQKAVFSGGHP